MENNMTIEPHNYKDMSGKQIGHWKVLEKAGISSNNAISWLCRCDCGTERIVRGEKLRQGKSNSCGCGNADDISGGQCGCWIARKLKRKCLQKTELTGVWAVVRPKSIKYPDGKKIILAWFHLFADAEEAAESINIPATDVVNTTVYLVTNKNDELDAEVFLGEMDADAYISRREGTLEWRCSCSDCGATKYFTTSQLKKNAVPKCECDPDFGNSYSMHLTGSTIGTWKVLKRSGTNHNRLALWECSCIACGDVRIMTSVSISSGSGCQKCTVKNRKRRTSP